MKETIVILFLLGLIIFMLVVMPHLIISRTIPRVINILRRHNAIGPVNAVAPEEMNLVQRPYMQRAFRMKDHKPNALLALISIDVILQDDDGKVYLNEEALAKSRWSHL